jgi:hypothetical protein
MWLINTEALRLEEFNSHNPPEFAILSHTWEPEGEVSFQAFKDLKGREQMGGFTKIKQTCRLAAAAGLPYAWVDTCCINKESSAELSEAINSMFQWYERSEVCYVYFSDLEPGDGGDFDKVSACRWFTRGWTLQELIAPSKRIFFDKTWTPLGQIAGEPPLEVVSRITGVDFEVLLDSFELYAVPVGRKMSWAAKRQTSRIEDMAYCLLGIFYVNMPMLYGEGSKAFLRLQQEISRDSADMTLFAWEASAPEDKKDKFLWSGYGVFAGSPLDFAVARHITPSVKDARFNDEFTLTNKGLRISTALGQVNNTRKPVFPLGCRITAQTHPERMSSEVGIYLRDHGQGIFERIFSPKLAIGDWTPPAKDAVKSVIYIDTQISGAYL